MTQRFTAQARYLPFLIFMLFIGVNSIGEILIERGLLPLPLHALYYLYPLRIAAVIGVLYYLRREYSEIDWKDILRWPITLGTIALGIVVYYLWIHMDWGTSLTGAPAGFDITLLPEGIIRTAMVVTRIIGAALIVPIMEELFWRSFLMRYIIDNNFISIPVGTFTWPSFVVSSLLFGLEHHFILAGIMAGVLYALLLYRSRSIAHCILAHAVTNLALSIHVISTKQWYFW